MIDPVNIFHKLLAKPRAIRGELFYAPIPSMRCKDGFAMSVQASALHYCSPRETAAWPYSQFEVGYPSVEEPLLMGYAEDRDRPTDTVYAWVPREVIEAVIDKHGGLV